MNPNTDFLDAKTHYLIVSASGKPVFSLNGSEENLVEYGAIIQALVSCFEDMKQTLQSFRAKSTFFVVKVEYPLILMAIDKLGQSETQLRLNIDVLHAQILSTLTKTQLTKAFQSRPGRDLRPLLEGTEVFLEALCNEMINYTPGIWLGAMESLSLKKHHRQQLHTILMEERAQDLLYGLIISDKRLVSVIRPRRHSLHPSDLFLLISMLFNTSSFQEGEHWIPICFPRFNSNGFLYAYISFLTTETAIVLVSPVRDAFFEMQKSGHAIAHKMASNDLLKPISMAVARRRPNVAEDIKASLVQHFVYKSKADVQFIESRRLEDRDKESELLLQYKCTQAFMQMNKVSICHSQWEDKTILGWVAPNFELYCLSTGDASRDALSNDLRKLVSWIRKHNERLFIIGGATF